MDSQFVENLVATFEILECLTLEICVNKVKCMWLERQFLSKNSKAIYLFVTSVIFARSVT